MRAPVQVVATAVAVAFVLVGCGGSDTESVERLHDRAGDAVRRTSTSRARTSPAPTSRALCSRARTSRAPNLSGANLSEADLSGARIVDTDLSDADLTSANLTGATISGANLDGATLCGTTRTDGTIDDTSCPASTDTTDTATTETTETTEAAQAEVTSFELSDLDCGSATTGPVTVTWETENATAVEIAVDTASPDRRRSDRVDDGRRGVRRQPARDHHHARERLRPGRPGHEGSELGLAADVDAAAAERVHPTPAAGDVEQLEVADVARAARDRRRGARPAARARASCAGAEAACPVDHACGLHAVGYCTGYFVCARGYPPNASGSRPSKNSAASRIPAAISAASSLKPYRRRPHAMNELSNGHTVPVWYPIGL